MNGLGLKTFYVDAFKGCAREQQQIDHCLDRARWMRKILTAWLASHDAPFRGTPPDILRWLAHDIADEDTCPEASLAIKRLKHKATELRQQKFVDDFTSALAKWDTDRAFSRCLQASPAEPDGATSEAHPTVGLSFPFFTFEFVFFYKRITFIKHTH